MPLSTACVEALYIKHGEFILMDGFKTGACLFMAACLNHKIHNICFLLPLDNLWNRRPKPRIVRDPANNSWTESVTDSNSESTSGSFQSLRCKSDADCIAYGPFSTIRLPLPLGNPHIRSHLPEQTKDLHWDYYCGHTRYFIVCISFSFFFFFVYIHASGLPELAPDPTIRTPTRRDGHFAPFYYVSKIPNTPTFCLTRDDNTSRPNTTNPRGPRWLYLCLLRV